MTPETSGVSPTHPVHTATSFVAAKPDMKNNYINVGKTRGQAQAEAHIVSAKCVNGARFCFMGAGFAAGFLAGMQIAAVTVASIAGIAAMATPVGWAIAGLVVVGLLILAARHIYLERQGMETNTKEEIIKATGLMVASFALSMGTHALAFSGVVWAAVLGTASEAALYYNAFRGGKETLIEGRKDIELQELPEIEGRKDIELQELPDKKVRIYDDDMMIEYKKGVYKLVGPEEYARYKKGELVIDEEGNLRKVGKDK